VLKYNVSLLLKPEVGATLGLDVDEVHQTLGDLKVDYVRGQFLLTRTRGVLIKDNSPQNLKPNACVA
jgi:hypothetical protein